MNFTKIINTILLILGLSSCSLAPFSPTTSGRSYGAGNIHSEAGNNNSSYHFKFGVGLNPDFDAGFLMEFGEISTSAVFLKYSFMNNKTGPSMASEFGYGSTASTIFYYGGLAASLAFSKEFELFINGRVNSVTTDESDIEKDKFHGNVKIIDYDITYLQTSVGFNIWFNENAGLSLYGTYFKGDNLETIQDTIMGGSFIFNL
jgi:hypothetical protein